MKRNLILLSAILLTVLITGCISSSGGGQVSGTSVNILKFEPELRKVTERDTVFVFMQVQNNGAFDAKETLVNLYLHGGFKEVGGAAENDEWEQDISKLRAPNSKLGTAGQTKEIRWELEAPEIGPGVKEKAFDFKADVSYNYEASTWKKFPIIEYTRIQKLRAESKPLPSSESGMVPAPIKIEINAYEPVVYKEGANSDAEIKVILTSIGDGFVKSRKDTTNSDCSSDLNCIDVVILKIPEGLEYVEGECDFSEEQSEGMVEGGFIGRQMRFVNLVDGEHAQLDCKLRITGEYMQSAEEMFPLVRAEAYYTHHVRGSTGLEVAKVVGR